MKKGKLIQGKCYINEEGRQFMKVYDSFTREARDALKKSKYNICAACLKREARLISYNDLRLSKVEAELRAIRFIEEQIEEGLLG